MFVLAFSDLPCAMVLFGLQPSDTADFHSGDPVGLLLAHQLQDQFDHGNSCLQTYCGHDIFRFKLLTF